MRQVQKEYKDRWNKPLINPPTDINGKPLEVVKAGYGEFETRLKKDDDYYYGRPPFDYEDDKE